MKSQHPSQFEHLKRRLAKQAQEDGIPQKPYSNHTHAQVAASGGSFERIKRRLNIKQKSSEQHEAYNELIEEPTRPIKHMPSPEAGAIITDNTPREASLTAGDLEHLMMNNNAGAPFALKAANELTLDEAMLMESELNTASNFSPSVNDDLLDLELQESHLAATKSATSQGYTSSNPLNNTTPNNNNNQEPSMNVQAPAMVTEQRKVPQLSVDNFGDTQPQDSAEYTSNVKTLIKLINELPEGVTKQTGAQIIRFTMEAMGIAMEEVLSEAQSTQSEMLDAVRGNIKKIEEYKTVIRKLESDIKFYQGKANELSEIIDLFILSSSSIKSHSEV